jgi:hypothetical protein
MAVKSETTSNEIIDSSSSMVIRAFFNYVTTGAFTPVGPLLAPVVKHDFQMSWALLIISKKSTLKKLHLPAFSYPLTVSTFPQGCRNHGYSGCNCTHALSIHNVLGAVRVQTMGATGAQNI